MSWLPAPFHFCRSINKSSLERRPAWTDRRRGPQDRTSSGDDACSFSGFRAPATLTVTNFFKQVSWLGVAVGRGLRGDPTHIPISLLRPHDPRDPQTPQPWVTGAGSQEAEERPSGRRTSSSSWLTCGALISLLRRLCVP